MLAVNKTKAALQGRLSHFSNFTEENNTVISLVNLSRFADAGNYGKSPGVTAAMPRFLSEGVRHWRSAQSPSFSGDLQSAENSADTWLAEKPADQPLGSIPLDCSSFRRTRFIQVARDESPSFFISASSCIRSSCWSRIWYWSVFALSLDIVITKSILSAGGCNYNVTEMVLQLLNTAKPCSARTLSGLLTKPLTGVPRRVKAWEMAYNNDRPVNSLYLVNRPVFPVRESEVKEVLIAAKQIQAECGQKVELIVFDTLARCFGGSDENDARDMGAFIEGCDIIKRETGATVLVVHHSGKDEAKGARGSSAFRAALDAEFNIKREGDAKALVLTCTKMKDSEEPERHAYDLRTAELFHDEDGELVTSLAVLDRPREVKEVDPALEGVTKLTDNHSSLWQSVRSRTAKGEPCTKAIIRDDLKAIGIDVKNFHRWLDKLEKEGVISLDGEKITPHAKVSD